MNPSLLSFSPLLELFVPMALGLHHSLHINPCLKVTSPYGWVSEWSLYILVWDEKGNQGTTSRLSGGWWGRGRGSEKNRTAIGTKFLLCLDEQGEVPFSFNPQFLWLQSGYDTSLLDSMRNDVLKTKSTCEGSLRWVETGRAVSESHTVCPKHITGIISALHLGGGDHFYWHTWTKNREGGICLHGGTSCSPTLSHPHVDGVQLIFLAVPSWAFLPKLSSLAGRGARDLDRILMLSKEQA